MDIDNTNTFYRFHRCGNLVDNIHVVSFTEIRNTFNKLFFHNLTPELVEEGFVRELISKIQTMRKEAGFEVMDRIAVSYEGNDKIAGIFKKNAAIIKAEVLADEILEEQTVGYVKEWSINGEQVTLGVEKR